MPQMPKPPRLRFDHLSATDAPFILELVNEPGWLQHIGDRNIHDLIAAEAYIANGPASSQIQYGFGLDRVSRLDSAEPIGLCGLLQRTYLDAPDVGYAFLQRHNGQGFATEALQAVLSDARQRLALPLLYAITSPDNTASIRVLEKCGFRFERFMLIPGATVQSRLFVLRF